MPRNRKLCWGMGLWVLVVWGSAQAAGSPDSTPTGTDPLIQWEQQSVQELLREELADTLREAREATDTPSSGTGRRAAQPLLAPRLVALYGVGRALMAEVQVGREAYLYVRGQPFPAGYDAGSGVYRLRAMNGACIQLERGEDRHALCLRMLLGQEAP